jgi:hypothetical protein
MTKAWLALEAFQTFGAGLAIGLCAWKVVCLVWFYREQRRKMGFYSSRANRKI